MVILPCSISLSASRREQYPASDKNLFTRIPSCSIVQNYDLNRLFSKKYTICLFTLWWYKLCPKLCVVKSGIPGFFSKISIESRSEEHTSELQSRENLVCRLL